MKSIATVKIGTKYSSSHVNKLFEKLNYPFYCLTDDPSGLHKDIIPIVPKEIYWPSEETWRTVTYNKITLFDPSLHLENILYLDLDVVIQKDIDILFREDYTIVWSYWRDESEMVYETHRPFCRRTMLNSSVMSWGEPPDEIWEDFAENKYLIMKQWPGDDVFLYKHLFEYKIYEEGLIDVENNSNAIILIGETSTGLEY